MHRKTLQLPAVCVRIGEEELTGIQGGRISDGFYTLGRMFSGFDEEMRVDPKVKELSDANGGVIARNGNTYTFANGTTCIILPEKTGKRTIRDFFFAVGDWFFAFGL